MVVTMRKIVIVAIVVIKSPEALEVVTDDETAVPPFSTRSSPDLSGPMVA
jgi:hypothetical protein